MPPQTIILPLPWQTCSWKHDALAAINKLCGNHQLPKSWCCTHQWMLLCTTAHSSSTNGVWASCATWWQDWRAGQPAGHLACRPCWLRWLWTVSERILLSPGIMPAVLVEICFTGNDVTSWGLPLQGRSETFLVIWQQCSHKLAVCHDTPNCFTVADIPLFNMPTAQNLWFCSVWCILHKLFSLLFKTPQNEWQKLDRLSANTFNTIFVVSTWIWRNCQHNQ